MDPGDFELWEEELQATGMFPADTSPAAFMARKYGLGLYQPQTDDEWTDYFEGER